MPYIIDGHNLIGKLHNISLQDIDDEAYLIKILDQYFRKIRKKAIIFFDRASVNGNNNFRSAFITVKFVRSPLNADKAIHQKLVELKGNARNYTVISSDRWVQEKARRVGAKIQKSEIFAFEIENQTRNPAKNDKNINSDVNFWLNMFNNDS